MLNLYPPVPNIALLISIVARENTDCVWTGTISIEAKSMTAQEVYLFDSSCSWKSGKVT